MGEAQGWAGSASTQATLQSREQRQMQKSFADFASSSIVRAA
jgi:hypothetical protein